MKLGLSKIIDLGDGWWGKNQVEKQATAAAPSPWYAPPCNSTHWNCILRSKEIITGKCGLWVLACDLWPNYCLFWHIFIPSNTFNCGKSKRWSFLVDSMVMQGTPAGKPVAIKCSFDLLNSVELQPRWAMIQTTRVFEAKVRFGLKDVKRKVENGMSKLEMSFVYLIKLYCQRTLGCVKIFVILNVHSMHNLN